MIPLFSAISYLAEVRTAIDDFADRIRGAKARRVRSL